MTVKEFLRSVRDANGVVDRKQRQLEELAALRTKVESTTLALNPDKVQGGRGNSNEDLMVRMIDLEHEMNAAIDDYIDRKRMAMQLIDQLADDRHIDLLYLYYLQGKTWPEVAVAMGYSWRHLHRLHGEALLALTERWHKMSLNVTMF